jgi:hypothetical protein
MKFVQSIRLLVLVIPARREQKNAALREHRERIYYYAAVAAIQVRAAHRGLAEAKAKCTTPNENAACLMSAAARGFITEP